MDTSSGGGPINGRPGGEQREWSFQDLVWLALAAVALFCVVFWAALGKPPLSGTKVVAALGFLFVVLVNLGIGALAIGVVIEWRHSDWSRFRDVDYLFIGLVLFILLIIDVGFAWWLFSSDSGGLTRWVFLVFALGAMAGGAVWAWPAMPLPFRRRSGDGTVTWALWPHHQENARRDERWRLFTPLTVLLGAAVGIVVAVGYLGISAWVENQEPLAGHPMPAAVASIHGGYAALGDSYSAGQGLPPFAPDTVATGCDRSISYAYPDLLFKWLRERDHQASFRFTACSGALISQILNPTDRPGGVVPPQINGRIQPSIGLVTFTIGGDNALFGNVVGTCLTSGDCLEEKFPPPGIAEQTAKPVPPGVLLTHWGPATIVEIGNEDAALFRTLRRDFPNARIVVLGYPYLFPSRPPPGFPFIPAMCASILNRLSTYERTGLRTLQDEFNDRIYEEAAISGVEFVSPMAIWDGHEPCGTSGQYTNTVKPYLNFPNPISGGSFHPNAAGQQALAALLACYLDKYHQPPDPFMAGQTHVHVIPREIVSPARLHLIPPPGLDSVPGSGAIHRCDV
jgi:hypothetical protein